jgi:para-nitrobenzyl esterase
VRGELAEGGASFKGISYAAPPIGPLRFQPPQPAAAWAEIRNAVSFGATAPKPPYAPPLDTLLPEPVIPGDDCLNLNVWTPDPGARGLPVMVWIHGGAFTNGSGAVPTYDGVRFARDGVVCVTMNYRLGAYGFLYLGEGTPNLGLLDQIGALHWVRENIAAFGGDPDNVTIFGQSAGAMSVTTLLTMPRADGLFRRAIAQSGAGHHVISPATAVRVGQYLAEVLGVAPSIDAIAAVPVDQLLRAQLQLAADVNADPDPRRWGEVAATRLPFEPVVDGELLPGRPIDRIAAGAGSSVDVLIGTNLEELHGYLVPSGVIDRIGQAQLDATITAYGLPIEHTLTTYGATRPDATPGDLLAAVVTDWYFRIPAVRVAEARTGAAAATYMYEFCWPSPQFGGRLGAGHDLEIPFVFDTLDSESLVGLWGDSPPQPLAAAMHAAWVSFARTGNPGWPRYEHQRRSTQQFNTTSQVVDDPRRAERLLWEGRR